MISDEAVAAAVVPMLLRENPYEFVMPAKPVRAKPRKSRRSKAKSG